MTITAPEPSRVAALGPAIDPADRRVARIAGVLFILTFIPQGLAAILEIAWEASLGLYLAIKGFKPSSPILMRSSR